MASLRELLLSIKVKVDKSGVQASDEAMAQATRSATGLERALKRVAAAQKSLGERKAKADEAFAQALGFGTKARPRAPRKDALKIDNTELLASLEAKPKSALEALKERFSTTFSAAGARVKQVTATVDGLAAKLFSVKMAFAGFAAAIVGHEIWDFIAGVVESGGALAEMSERTRVSVEALQGWKGLAADSSIDISVLESSFRKLSKSMRASEKGTSAQGKAFALLGVDAKNADGKGLRPVEDVLIDVGVALNQMEDDATATAIATQLLGPAGYGLVPIFEKGGDAVRKYLKSAKENASISTDQARRLDEVGDATARGAKKWAGLRNRLVVSMLPVLEFLSQKFEAVSKWMLTVAKQSQIFQTVLLALASGGIARVVILLASWVAKAGGARAAMTLLGGGLRTAAGFALRFIAPLLIIEDFLTFLAGGKSLFGRAFNEIFGEGGAKKVRDGLLNVFTKLKNVIGELGSAVRGIGSSDLFTGTAKAALDAILLVLNAIGAALASDTDKANALWAAFDRRKQKFVQDATGHKPGDELPRAEKGITDASGNVDYNAPTGTFLDKIPFGKYIGNKLLRGSALSNPAIADSYAQNNAASMSVVPPAMLTGSAANVSRNVTLTDKRTIEVNVGGNTSNPGTTGRAVASSLDSALETDARQVLQSISE